MYTPAQILKEPNVSRVWSRLSHNASLDLETTVSDCFFIRDIHSGLGQRSLGRMCFDWLANEHPLLFIRVLPQIPKYGRWDDLLHVTNSDVHLYVCAFLANQLREDAYRVMCGQRPSLCAKWMPTEGKSFARKNPKFFQSFLRVLGWTPREYRIYLSELRRTLDLPENNVRRKTVFRIDFPNLPIGARKKYAPLFPTNGEEVASSGTHCKSEERYAPVVQELI